MLLGRTYYLLRQEEWNISKRAENTRDDQLGIIQKYVMVFILEGHFPPSQIHKWKNSPVN